MEADSAADREVDRAEAQVADLGVAPVAAEVAVPVGAALAPVAAEVAVPVGAALAPVAAEVAVPVGAAEAPAEEAVGAKPLKLLLG